MAYSMEQFLRETREYALKGITPEEVLAILRDLPAEERLRCLKPEERLRGLGPEERLRGLDEKDLDKLRALLNRGK